MFLIAISLAAVVAVSTAWQIENGNAASFLNAGRHACISALVPSGGTDINGSPVVSWDCHSDEDSIVPQDWGYGPSEYHQQTTIRGKKCLPDVEDCNLNAGPTIPQDWIYTPFGHHQQFKILGDKCLDVKDGVNADGTQLQLWECQDQNLNQLWTHNGDGLGTEHILQWDGTNKCVDLTDGKTNNGNPLQIWTCNTTYTNLNQRWFTYPGSMPSLTQEVPIVAGIPGTHGRAFGLIATQNQDRASVALVDFTSPSPYPSGSRNWTIPSLGSVGHITTFGGKKCLGVTGSSNGDSLQIVKCNIRDPTQLWKIGGFDRARSISSWFGKTKCIHHGENLSSNLPKTPIWDCNPDSRGQWWMFQ